MAGRKQKPPKDLIMMTPGLRAQIPASPSLSTSSRRPLHYTNGGYDSPESLNGHDYEDLEFYNQSTGPRKQPNVIYETSGSLAIPAHLGTGRHRQFTECSDDSTSSGSEEQHYGHKKSRCNWRDIILVVIVFISFGCAIVVGLMALGKINASCSADCSNKQVTGGAKYLTKINKRYEPTSNLVERIKTLEKNITSLVIRDTLMMAVIRSHEKTITDLQEKLATAAGTSDKESQSTKQFQQNITNEVRSLREKQDDFGSSLENIKTKDNTTNIKLQEIDTKFLGLAVTVNYLTLNDSLIKSRVHNLAIGERKLNSELTFLKQKDVEMETSLQSLKSADSSFNSSVNKLQLSDKNLKAKIDALNSTSTLKIKNITNVINAMKVGGGQQGPPGPPGPRGPPGAGNLTRCEHVRKSASTKSQYTSDKAHVYYKVPKDKILLGATCSTKAGDETYLTFNKTKTVYQCNCRGKSSYSYSQLECYIDAWICPRIS